MKKLKQLRKSIQTTLALVLSLAPASQVHAVIVQARQADSFVDSIGVNTHLSWPIYADRFATVIKPRLQELGVRHIRDGFQTFQPAGDKVRDLYNTLGIKATLITDHTVSGPQMRDFILNSIGTAPIAAIEGTNEPDLFIGSNWQNITRAHQQSLYSAFKGNSVTASIPILAPSVVGMENAQSLGSLANYTDACNIHPYPSGRNPETPGFGAFFYGVQFGGLDHFIQNVGNFVCSSSEPKYVTETGYHNALVNSGHRGTSDAVAAKYFPRLFLHYFNKGVQRTFTYELFNQETIGLQDPEANFGIVRYNNTPKPAFTAMKNLIALIKDPGPSFAPGSLDYALSGSTQNVSSTLLRKRDGSFILALWLNNRIWNAESYTAEPVSPQSVTLTLPASIASAATVRPNSSSTWTAAALSNRALNLSVTDSVLLVRLTPGAVSSGSYNLVVTDIRWTPASPVNGSRMVFTATIKNTGTKASPALVHGVGFTVNNTIVSWSDSYRSSIAPGASVSVQANGGPSGVNYWTTQSGTFSIRAMVDDINRMPAESNESDNVRTESLVVP